MSNRSYMLVRTLFLPPLPPPDSSGSGGGKYQTDPTVVSRAASHRLNILRGSTKCRNSPPYISLQKSQHRRRRIRPLLRVGQGEDNSFDVGCVSAHVLLRILNVPIWRGSFGWQTAGRRSITTVRRRGCHRSSILALHHAVDGSPLRGGRPN